MNVKLPFVPSMKDAGLRGFGKFLCYTGSLGKRKANS